MSDEARKPIDLAEMYRRALAGDRHDSWHNRWSAAVADVSLQELAGAAEEAFSLLVDAQGALADRLLSLGHPAGFHGRHPTEHLYCDWFIAPFHGEPSVHFGVDVDQREWYVEPIDVEAANNVSDAGGYTIVLTTGHGYEIFETAKRVEPLPWAAKCAAKP